jgi:hypothetical protein
MDWPRDGHLSCRPTFAAIEILSIFDGWPDVRLVSLARNPPVQDDSWVKRALSMNLGDLKTISTVIHLR